MKTTLLLPLVVAVAVALCARVGAENLPTRLAEPPAAAVDAPDKAADPASQDLVRAYLQIQEQLHATQLALERNRLQAEEAAASNALALATRLNSLEKNMEEQRAQETHVILSVAGIIIGCGLIVMFLVSYLQLRAMNRFAEVALGLPVNQLNQLAAGGSAGHLLGNGAVESGTRLTATIERLEKRIRELESATPSLPPAATNNGGNAARIETLLANGQSLLARDQAAAADAAFDAALALDPNHVEALIKKGAALEKLAKLDEAIACYDRVIAADSTVTIAYLYKGGVFNRLERYPEALACYEQALQTQEKSRAA